MLRTLRTRSWKRSNPKSRPAFSPVMFLRTVTCSFATNESPCGRTFVRNWRSDSRHKSSTVRLVGQCMTGRGQRSWWIWRRARVVEVPVQTVKVNRTRSRTPATTCLSSSPRWAGSLHLKPSVSPVPPATTRSTLMPTEAWWPLRCHAPPWHPSATAETLRPANIARVSSLPWIRSWKVGRPASHLPPITHLQHHVWLFLINTPPLSSRILCPRILIPGKVKPN